MSAVLAPLALAGAGERTVVSEEFTLAGNNLSTQLAKCKAGSQVTGGGFSITLTDPLEIGTRVKSLFPTGDRKWYAVIDNLRSEERQAKSYAVCRKGDKLSIVEEPDVVDGSVDQRPDVTAKCPKGSSATGGGAVQTGSHLDTYTMESRPKGDRGWYVRSFVTLDFIGEHAAYVICDPEKSNEYESVAKIEPRRHGPHRAAARRSRSPQRRSARRRRDLLERRRHVKVPDPDGNPIAFAEPPDSSSALWTKST